MRCEAWPDRLSRGIPFILFILLPFVSNVLRAEIIEIGHFEELVQYQQPGALCILDIDNTLIVPAQTLGCDEWFYHIFDKYRAEGASAEAALEKALALWEAVQCVTKVNLVEPHTDTLVRWLQERQVPIIGLSTRGLSLATRTVAQLASVNIDLSVTAPALEDIPLKNGQVILYRKGILFTCGTHKGHALLKLFKEINYTPAAVVFINDKAAHLAQVEETCEQCGISFTGLRYGYTDEKVQNFQPELAEVQLANFGHLLSDATAAQYMNLSR